MINLYGGLALYAIATVLAFSALRTGDRRGLAAARLGALFGALDHAVFLTLLGIRTGHFPVTGALEAYLFLSTLLVALSLALDWLKRWSILVVATLPLALITTLLALALSFAPEGASSPELDTRSAWTALHVFTAVGSYGAFALAFISAMLYLVAQRQLKLPSAGEGLGLIPPLETVSRILRTSIAAGIVLLAGGLVVGYLQARHVLGKGPEWRNDPKIYLTTLTLLVYIVILALSRRPVFKGRRTALASILGFLLVMTTFWASVFWSGFHRFR